MEWERQIRVGGGGADGCGQGASEEIYRKIIFFKKDAAPKALVIEDRKLSAKGGKGGLPLPNHA